MSRSTLALIKPALLVWARESLGLNREAAARLLSIEESRLAAWEDGAEAPTIAQLRDISRIYRRPLAVFFLSDPPKEFSVPRDFRTVFGTGPEPATAELLVEIRRAQFRRDLAASLISADDSDRALLRLKPSLSDDPVGVAKKARQVLRIPVDAQLGWTDEYHAIREWRRALELQEILIFQFGDVAVSEARGFSLAERPFPAICANAKDAPAARVFTIAHELGHVLLGASGICTPREVDQPRSADARTEAWCNAFAAELLVPADALLQTVRDLGLAGSNWPDEDLKRIAGRFRVSKEVVLRRLVTLGKAPRALYESRRKEFARPFVPPAGGRITQSGKAIRNCGVIFSRAVMDALAREEITVADASEFLEVKVRHFADIEDLLRNASAGTGALA